MKNIYSLFFFNCLFASSISSYAQVGIGTTTPDPSSVLHINSDISPTRKGGFILPTVSNDTERAQIDISNAPLGLVIFNNSGDRCFQMFDPANSNWVNMNCLGATSPPSTRTTIEFVNTSSVLNEGAGQFLDIEVLVNNPSPTEDTRFLVTLDNSSTARNGIDYDDGGSTPNPIEFPKVFTVPAGSSAKQSFRLNISVDDTDVDIDETVILRINSISGGNDATFGEKNEHRITIKDNETPLYSQLWGVNGELWDPINSQLRDFTNVGYKSGDEEIPDWPIGVNVMDFGAKADGITDDGQAFLDAIDACPPNSAVFVPNGNYKIAQFIEMNKNDIVIRGEDMFETKILFTEYLSEIYPNDFDRTSRDAFLRLEGGKNRGIENMSFIFRDQQKGPRHWGDQTGTNPRDADYLGANAILITSGEEDSWLRNIYIKNANHAITVRGNTTKRLSILNIILDNFLERKNLTDNKDGHVGISVADSQYCLVHNMLIKGVYNHDVSADGCKNSVFSKISGENLAIDHHAFGSNFNLFTEIDTGYGDRGYGASVNNFNETYWHIDADTDKFYLPTSSESVMVGLKTDAPSDLGLNHWHETIDPAGFLPRNLYLAQRGFLGENLPKEIKLSIPELDQKSTFDIISIADNVVKVNEPDTVFDTGFLTTTLTGNGNRDEMSYLKFDLSDINLENPASSVKFRLFKGVRESAGNIALQKVNDDNWREDELTFNNAPTPGDIIETVSVFAPETWYEWDVTDFVNQELNGDKIISFYLRESSQRITNGFRSREGANRPTLRIVP